VDDVSLRVARGEVFGLLGPNGAGKSTTMGMLCGLLRPTAGCVRVAGHDVEREPLAVKRHTGVLDEDTVLYERLTGIEHLEFVGQMHGLTRREARRRAEELLALMDMTGAADTLILEYSMGMKRKTALAGALIHGPDVLFLDEPFNGLDPLSVRALAQTLRRLATERGTTVFLTSHTLDLLERLCSRFAVIHGGTIAASGTLPDLRAQSRTGADASLEDVFLRLIRAPSRAPSLSWL
jgi:ABC-2 type transport system ATP-binding protein